MSVEYVDASSPLSSAVGCFSTSGIKAVGRYYNHGAGAKVLSRQEAQGLIANNISIWVVFEYYNNASKWFTAALGQKDAMRALQCAQEVVGQPEGTTIYFSADYDEDGTNYASAIVPYFKAVHQTFTRADGTMPFRIGVYSDGLVCTRLLADGLVTDTWLSCSSSFPGTRQFYQSRTWSIAQHCGVPNLCGIGIDSDEVSRDDFGQFKTLVPLNVSHTASAAKRNHAKFIASANTAETISTQRSRSAATA
jgi:hypothetical protein